MDHPRFASGLSTASDSATAEAEVLAAVASGLDGRTPDLAVVFVTHHHGTALEGLGPRLRRATGARVLIGCTGVGVIGSTREVEREPALSLWTAALPGTEVEPFSVTATAGPDDEPIFSSLPDIADRGRASLLLLADPYSFPADRYLQAVDAAAPGVPVMGGLSSGGHGPGQNLLITADGLAEGGAVGVRLEGAIELRSVVSQGCRPVGKPWVVTASKENMLQKLGGRTAAEVLMETLRELVGDDQSLFQRAPFVGLAVDPTKSEFERGDFLVRQIMGLHPQEGSVAVGDVPRRGQTIQFLVRDADSAGEDLRLLLQTQGGGPLGDAAPHSAGALLFSCNGRGTHMFPVPDHDVTCVHGGLSAELPVAGFFAAGEIGPVGGRNFLHGFTASVAIFRPRSGA